MWRQRFVRLGPSWRKLLVARLCGLPWDRYLSKRFRGFTDDHAEIHLRRRYHMPDELWWYRNATSDIWVAGQSDRHGRRPHLRFEWQAGLYGPTPRVSRALSGNR